MRIETFPKRISPKVDVIVQVEIEHTFYDVGDQHSSHRASSVNYLY